MTGFGVGMCLEVPHRGSTFIFLLIYKGYRVQEKQYTVNRDPSK